MSSKKPFYEKLKTAGVDFKVLPQGGFIIGVLNLDRRRSYFTLTQQKPRHAVVVETFPRRPDGKDAAEEAIANLTYLRRIGDEGMDATREVAHQVLEHLASLGEPSNKVIRDLAYIALHPSYVPITDSGE